MIASETTELYEIYYLTFYANTAASRRHRNVISVITAAAAVVCVPDNPRETLGFGA